MKEKDILYQNGEYWVCADKIVGMQNGKRFSFPGFKIYKLKSIYSLEMAFSFKLDRAVAMCNYFSKIKK